MVIQLWLAETFRKVGILAEASRRKSPSFGVVWMEERGTKTRSVMEMRVGFEKHGETPYNPYLDESRGERQAGAKWWGTYDSNFTLCAMEYHWRAWNMSNGNSFPSLYFILGLFYCWQSPNTTMVPHTQQLGNSVLLRSVCVKLCGWWWWWSRVGGRFSSSDIGKILFPWEKSRRSRFFLYQEWNGHDTWWWPLLISLLLSTRHC